MIRFYAIAKNTFLQTIRQPIFGVMIFLTFAMLVLSLPLAGLTMGTDYEQTDELMMENLGLSTLLIMGLITAALSASSAIGREIEDKTALTVASKPVARATFVLGKFSGITLAVTIAYYLAAIVFLLTVRHKVVSAASVPINWPVVIFGVSAFVISLVLGGLGNFMFNWSFIATTCMSLLVFMTAAFGLACIIDLHWDFVSIVDTFSPDNIKPSLILAMILIFMAIVLLTAVATAASTRLGQVPTLLITFAILAAGSWYLLINMRLNEYFAGPGKEVPLVNMLCWLIPNMTVFFPLDALTSNKPIPLSVVGIVACYCACYTAAVLAIGVALYQTRQIEAQSASTTMPSSLSLLSGVGRIAGIIIMLISLIMVTLPANHTRDGYITIGLLFVCGALMWYVTRVLGSGRRWSWWLLTIVSGLILIRGAVLWKAGGYVAWLYMGQATPGVLTLSLVGAAVFLLLMLPKTRRHVKALNMVSVIEG